MNATKIATFTLAEVTVHVWHEPGEGHLGILGDRLPEPADPAFGTPLAAVAHHLGAEGAARASVRWIDASHDRGTP